MVVERMLGARILKSDLVYDDLLDLGVFVYDRDVNTKIGYDSEQNIFNVHLSEMNNERAQLAVKSLGDHEFVVKVQDASKNSNQFLCKWMAEDEERDFIDVHLYGKFFEIHLNGVKLYQHMLA